MDSQTFVSGKRLRAVVLDGGDGAVTFLRWHDTQLDIDCSFAKTTDGAWRCLPTTPDPVGFVDAACGGERVARLRAPTRSYVIEDGDSGCSAGQPSRAATVWNVGAERPGPSGTLYYAFGGRCFDANYPLDDSRFYDLSPGDPGMFVRAELRREANGEEVTVEVLAAEDGSREIARMIDSKRDLACKPAPGPRAANGAERRCLPALTPSSIVYADAACTEVRASVSPYAVDCGDPPVAIEETWQSCSVGDYRIWSLGPRESGDAFTTSAGDVCTPLAAPAPIYRRTGELAKEAFPALHVTMVGRGRLQAPFVAGSKSERPLSRFKALESYGDVFWDSARSFYCYPEKFADGVTRCIVENVGSIVLPGNDATATYLRFYGDPSCKGEQLANPHSGCGDPVYAVVHDSNLLGVGARPIKRRYAGRTYWATSDATGNECREYGQGADELWEVGDLVAPDDVFARVTERTE